MKKLIKSISQKAKNIFIQSTAKTSDLEDRKNIFLEKRNLSKFSKSIDEDLFVELSPRQKEVAIFDFISMRMEEERKSQFQEIK